MLNEVEILKSLDHPNIIKLYEFYETSQTFCLVFEYFLKIILLINFFSVLNGWVNHPDIIIKYYIFTKNKTLNKILFYLIDIVQEEICLTELKLFQITAKEMQPIILN